MSMFLIFHRCSYVCICKCIYTYTHVPGQEEPEKPPTLPAQSRIFTPSIFLTRPNSEWQPVLQCVAAHEVHTSHFPKGT